MPRWSGSTPRRAVAGALLAAVLTTACTSGSEQPDPTTAPTPTEPSPEQPAGTITVAIPHEPATLDPFSPAGTAPATRDITRLLMPALWRTGPMGERVRWLLASDPAEVDARTIEIALRDDAVWSDGRPITVADLEHTRAHAVQQRMDGYDAIERIEALSPKRARIRFRSGVPQPVHLFSSGLGVLPAHVPVEQLRRTWPVSGGPFTLRRWRAGLDVLLEANPRTWGTPAPSFQGLRLAFVPDPVGALELFRRGDVDVLGSYMAPDWLRRVGEVSAATRSAETGQTWVALVFNTDEAPFADQRVRRALAHAIDRGRIARGLVGDEGAPLHGAPPGGTARFDAYGDIERARALLDRAGWTGSPRRRSGSTLDPTIAFVGDDLSWIVVRAIQFQARRAGFDLQAVPLDTRQLWQDWLRGNEQRVALLVLRDPPEGTRARFGIGSRDAATSVPVLPLYQVAVILAARDIGGVCASASSDGPFWNANEWTMGAAEASCPTLLPAAA